MLETMNGAEIFDGHVHAWDAGAVLAPARLHTPTICASGADLTAVWNRHGIAGGVLVQPSFFGTDNSSLVRLLAEDSTRRRGVIAVAPPVDPAAFQNWHAAGVRAIRFNTVSATALPDFEAPGWRAILQAVGALGWHLEVTARAAAWPHLLPDLLRTGLVICVDHWGWPGTDDTDEAGWHCLIATMRAEHIWMKLSAPYRIFAGDLDDRLARLLDADVLRRLMWGSDWPFLRHETATTYLRELTTARDMLSRAGIWPIAAGGNLRTLYGF